MDVLGVDDMTAIFNMKGLVTVRSVPMRLLSEVVNACVKDVEWHLRVKHWEKGGFILQHSD